MKNTKPLKIVALLTGRGGSSMKDKNVLPVGGHPLLSYPARAALDSVYITDYYVSSDDEKILDTAEKYGYKRIQRPAELASDTAQHKDAITHALKVMKKKDGVVPDIVVVLLANTVAVKTDWIDSCVQELIDDQTVTCAAPVYNDSNHHPIRGKKVDENGCLVPLLDLEGNDVSTNRQDLYPSYFFCHNFWVLRSEIIDNPNGQKPWVFMGNKIKPYFIDCPYIDIHDEDDLEESERWLKRHG
ncbi:MAG: CMP-N,N'-diacetyllegionaminic acid synthase [Acidimicrobiales bacterium]|jgi:CMP-N,N'-diacetyllegionaminic acid synthase